VLSRFELHLILRGFLCTVFIVHAEGTADSLHIYNVTLFVRELDLNAASAIEASDVPNVIHK
jgi:hypothetical protein